MQSADKKSNNYSILKKLIKELQETQTENISALLNKHKIKKTDSAFSIPKDRGIDIIIDDKRYFLYNSSDKDRETHKLLEEHNLSIYPPIELDEGEKFSAIRLPFDAISLARILYPEQELTQGAYLGACEIMVQLGKFIKRIQKTTHLIPQYITLDAFISAPSEKELIQIVPPLLLVVTPPLAEIKQSLINSLKSIDPNNDHDRQVQVFINNYLS